MIFPLLQKGHRYASMSVHEHIWSLKIWFCIPWCSLGPSIGRAAHLLAFLFTFVQFVVEFLLLVSCCRGFPLAVGFSDGGQLLLLAGHVVGLLGSFVLKQIGTLTAPYGPITFMPIKTSVLTSFSFLAQGFWAFLKLSSASLVSLNPPIICLWYVSFCQFFTFSKSTFIRLFFTPWWSSLTLSASVISASHARSTVPY